MEADPVVGGEDARKDTPVKRRRLSSATPDGFIDIPRVHWNALFIPRTLVLRQLLAVAGGVTGSLIDVGCGTSPYRNLFSNVDTYVGVDVRTSSHPLPPGSLVFDGYALPVRPHSMDTALATEVLEHVRAPRELLAAVLEVLKPGGMLLLTVPFAFPVHEPPHDYQRWTRFGLELLVREAGFEVQTLVPLGDWNSTLSQLLQVYAAQLEGSLARSVATRFTFRLSQLMLTVRPRTRGEMCVGYFLAAKAPQDSSANSSCSAGE